MRFGDRLWEVALVSPDDDACHLATGRVMEEQVAKELKVTAVALIA